MINYVTIRKFCQETGYTEDAVRSKITRGDWAQGKEFTKAPDGRILIIMSGYESWVEQSIGELGHQVKAQSKSISTIKIKGAENVSSLSPLPLI